MNLCSRRIRQLLRDRSGVRKLCAHGLDRVEIESRQSEERAEDAQDLPCGARFTGRQRDAAETLRASLTVDKGPCCLGERCDGKLRMSVVCSDRREGREGDDQLCGRESGTRRQRVGDIEIRLGVEKNISASRLSQHRLRVQPPLARQCSRHMAAYRVRRLGEKPESCAGQFCKRVSERVQLRRVRMLLSEIPEEDALALAAAQAGRNVAGDLGRRAPSECRGNRGARSAGCGGDDLRESPCQCRGRNHQAIGHRHQQLFRRRMHHGELRALADRPSQTLREQRLVLAQETPDHEHAVERGELGDRQA